MKRIIIWFILAIFFSFLLLLFVFEAQGKMLVVTKKEHGAFFKKLEQRGLPGKYINDIFSDERAMPDLRVLKKGKPVNYFSKETNLFEPESVTRGKKFLAEERIVLQKAEDIFGVPKEISVSIFRLETDMGQFLGRHRVFSALYTLFIFKARSWAETELVNFFQIGWRHQYDLLAIFGSKMGCFGLFQFLPSSFLTYAIDGNGDGRINLFDFPDALFSAANYLKGNGWEANDRNKVRRALWRYNNWDEYGKAVLGYAEVLNGGVPPELLSRLPRFRTHIEERYGYKVKKTKNNAGEDE